MRFLENSLALFGIVLVRYFAVSGGLYWVLWRKKREQLTSRRLQPRSPEPRVVRAEIGWSIATSAIFALSGAFMLEAYERGWTRVYLHVQERGWGYFFFSIALLAVLHDTYFYWTHRLMHHPRLFTRVHGIHHDSLNPTPWAAFSFHPWEAVIEAVILPALALMIPVHPAAFVIFLTMMTVLGVINHCGYELYPAAFGRNPLLKQIISATHHDQHHRKFRGNYGLYFTTWDRIMGTHDPSYEKTYELVQARIQGT